MSACKTCPLHNECEQDLEQVIYCRHVEMLKKIGLLRAALAATPSSQSTNMAILPTGHSDQIQVHARSVSEPKSGSTPTPPWLRN